MSRIGKKPIIIPEAVTVEQDGQYIKVTGPLGSLQMKCHPRIKVEIDNSARIISVKNEHPENRINRQLHGTMRALIANMVTGVTQGFQKKMEIYGTGYGVKQQGEKLIFQVGFSHPVEWRIPEGIKVDIEVGVTKGDDVPAKFMLSSIDKALLGQAAAEIRKIRPPEPYKGKGIRYAGEEVRRKVGKAFASGAV